MSYSVTYWVCDKGKKPVKHTDEACFSRLNYAPQCDSVRYMANVDNDLDIKDIRYFLDFAREWLDGKLWQEKHLKGLKDHRTTRRIFYVLKSKGMKPVQRLLYLTTLRYVDEFPEIIREFAKRAKALKTSEERFAELQNVHDDAERRKFAMKYGNLGGHGLMRSYYRSGNIAIKDFKAKITKASSVNAMWNASP